MPAPVHPALSKAGPDLRYQMVACWLAAWNVGAVLLPTMMRLWFDVVAQTILPVMLAGGTLGRFRRCRRFRSFHLAFWLLLSFARDGPLECHHHCASIVCGPCKPRSRTSTETFAIHESPIVCRMGCFESRSMSRFGFPRQNEASPSRQIA